MPGPSTTPDAAARPAGTPDRASVQSRTGERDRVLSDVVAMITEVIGPDELVGIDIGDDTSFQEDLEVESIEFVALSEQLMARYGAEVDFVGWMASMELDEIIALTVGDLVDFVVAPA
ncbi:acyl carrier protein [Acidiferrimicrobium sp. IK]|uniref:acyl carrier protein n=1 Tax=Acidiferrimicrobium sp. IK TaxID=2871700 RepID=UPI0021CB7211|nr:acyl carrier protein [Acidiferrimicrobium sp. IK]MCU4187007.1 acyl carrier protein [Acidiferrimicrobium sp. IK]